jgi:hypothetical protein
MSFSDFFYKLKGIDPSAKRAYVSLFNSGATRSRGSKVIEDLILRFRFYGAKPTSDPILLAKQAAYREVIEYILTMAARVSQDTLSEIESIINKGGNADD